MSIVRTYYRVVLLLTISALSAAFVFEIRSGDQARPLAPAARAWAVWARDIESISELLYTPDTIAIVGKVVAVGDGYPVGDGVPFTNSEIRVTQVLVGEHLVSVGDELVVRQNGGDIPGGRSLHFDDLRLFEVNEQVLLFLTFEDLFGLWAPTGGPHGHFTIEGDTVTHANFTDPDVGLSARHPGEHPLAALVSGRTASDVFQNIRAVAAARR